MDDERLKRLGGGGYWKELLDRIHILSSTGSPLLQGPGSVSHKQAMQKAEEEYRKYDVRTLSPVEQAYLKTIKKLNDEAKKNQKKKGGK